MGKAQVKRGLLALAFAFLTLLIGAEQSTACPDGQYNACLLGVCGCVPNGGTVVTAINPLPDILHTANGVVHGNIQAISQGVGGLIVKGTCSGCAIAAQTILGAHDKAFVETLVGRGWLLFIAGADPSIVFVDAATSLVREYELRQQAANPLQPAPPPARGTKNYKVANARCMVKSESTQTVAGWVDPPVLVNSANNQQSTFPAVDLQPGDNLMITSLNKECAAPPKCQTLLKSATIKYLYSSVQPGSSTDMKYFLIGTFVSGT